MDPRRPAARPYDAGPCQPTIWTSGSAARSASGCANCGTRGYTQPVCAERAGISVAYLSEIETGRRNPTVAIVVRLARALDLKPSQLMGRLDQIE